MSPGSYRHTWTCDPSPPPAGCPFAFWCSQCSTEGPPGMATGPYFTRHLLGKPESWSYCITSWDRAPLPPSPHLSLSLFPSLTSYPAAVPGPFPFSSLEKKKKRAGGNKPGPSSGSLPVSLHNLSLPLLTADFIVCFSDGLFLLPGATQR